MSFHGIKKYYRLTAFFLMLLLFTACAEKTSLKNNSQFSGNNASSKTPVDIYIGGSIILPGSNFPAAGYWKNGKWTTLCNEYSEVTSLVVNGNDVYAGGFYWSEWELAVPGYWKNGKWNPLQPVNPARKCKVKVIAVSGNDVYAGGSGDDKGSKSIDGYWKNGKWTALKPVYVSCLLALTITGNDVYAGGYTLNEHKEWIPGYWKNGGWVALPSIDPKEHAGVTSIAISGNDVYASGISKDSTHNSVSGYWRNGVWVGLPPFAISDYSHAKSIVVSGSDVYVGGNCKTKMGFYGVVIAGYWKNGKWTGLAAATESDNGSKIIDSELNKLLVYGDDVYAIGIKSYANGSDVPGYWKNGKWNPLECNPKLAQVASIVVVPRLDAVNSQ